MADKRVARAFQNTSSLGAAIEVTERREILASRSRVKKNRPSKARHTVNPIKNPPANRRVLKIYLPYSAITCPLQVLHRIAIGGQ